MTREPSTRDRRRPRRGRRTRRTMALALTALMSTSVAFGYWSAPGVGSATGSLVDLSTPALTVTNPVLGTAHIAWTAATLLPAGSGPNGEVTYLVDRRPTSGGAWTAVCQTDVTPLTAGQLSCDNNNVSVTNDYDYRLTAHLRSWSVQITTTAHILADTVAPAVTLTAPAAGSLLTSATPTLSGAAGTAIGDLATVTVSVCPGASPACGSPVTLAATASGGTWSVAPSSALPDGTHTAVARQTDNAGNTGSSAPRTFVIDTQDPAVAMTAPADGANVRQTITMTATASDPLKDGAASGLATVQFQRSPAGAGTWTDIGAALAAGPYTLSLNTATLADGQYDLRAVATDAAGNIKRATKVTVRVDNTNPAGAITAPAAGAYVSSTVTITSSSSDPAVGGSASGVASAQFQRSPAGAGTWTNIGAADTAAPFDASLNATPLAQGTYDLRVITTDNAGNTFTSGVSTIRVDHTVPTAAVSAPANGATIRGNVALTATSTDPVSGGLSSGVAGVKFQTSPGATGVWTDVGPADTTSPYGATLVTTALANGSYSLRAVSTDVAGNVTNSAAITVTVANPYPTAVALTNNFGTLGTADGFDSARVTFNEAMNPGSICSGWNGAQIANATLTVTITDNGANDVLTVTSTGCTVNFGSLALGADYVSATRDFGGSSFASFSRMQYDTATNALTVYLGAQKVAGGVNTNVPAGALTYTPSASMLSATGFAPSAGPFTFAADRF